MSELKHRKLARLNIVDLRIFNYLQTTNLIDEGSFLGSVFSSIDKRLEFNTNSLEIYRDYINAELFYDAVESVLSPASLNRGFDLYSKAHTSKSDILTMLSREFGLRINLKDDVDFSNFNLTGIKKHYYSKNKDIGDFGYSPNLSSLCMIKKEANRLFKDTSFGLDIQ